MTNFFLVMLAFTQIPVVFVFTSRAGIRLASYYCLKRNPDWVAKHPEFKVYTLINSVALGFSYLVAAVSVFAILKYVFITPTPGYYVLLLVAPLTIWTLGYLVYFVAFYMAVTREIPAPALRKASLTDRRLSTFVPMWTVYLCYGFLALIVIIYSWALMSETLGGQLATARIVGLGGVIILGTGVLLVTLRRKYSEMEGIIGPSGRKVEVIGSLAVLYLGVLAGVHRILGDFFNISLFSDASFFVAISLIIQAYFLAYCLHPKVRLLLRNSLRAIHTTTKLPVNHGRRQR